MQGVAPIESLLNRNRPIVIHDLQQELHHRSISEAQVNDTLSMNTESQAQNTKNQSSAMKENDLVNFSANKNEDIIMSLKSHYEDDNDTEVIVKLERHNNQLKQVIESLQKELEDLSDKYKELLTRSLEQKETYNSKLMSIFNEFSDERGTLVHKLKIAEEKLESTKYELKSESKDSKIKQLTQKLSEIRQEHDSEVASSNSTIKSLKSELSNTSKQIDNQQDELDKLNGILLEKQTQLDILSETLQSVQSGSNSSIMVRYLSQNAELCCVKSLNIKLEKELDQLYSNIKHTKSINEDLQNNVQKLTSELEENRYAYEQLVKEVDQCNESVR